MYIIGRGNRKRDQTLYNLYTLVDGRTDGLTDLIADSDTKALYTPTHPTSNRESFYYLSLYVLYDTPEHNVISKIKMTKLFIYCEGNG